MSRQWTDEEKAYLKKHYNSLPIANIEKQLGRSANSIRSQVNYLRKRGWTFNRIKDE